MKKVVKKTSDKFLTETKFEKSMQSVAKSFADQADVMQMMLKEIKTIHQDNRYFKENIVSLNSDGLSYDKKIENLTIRIEKLELKVS